VDRLILIIVRFSVYVALPGLSINKCTRRHRIAIDLLLDATQYVMGITLVYRVPTVALPMLVCRCIMPGNRMRHSDSWQPRITGSVSHVFLTNVHCGGMFGQRSLEAADVILIRKETGLQEIV
jgi:hypothetical protein